MRLKFETCWKRSSVFVAIVLCANSQAHGAGDLYVDLSNPACPGAGTSVDPFCTIQGAIQASTHGDIIHVAPGIYTEHVIVDGLDISILATSGSYTTTIDANGSGSVLTFRNGGWTTPLVEGFTLTGGTGTEQRGGGVYIDGASPTLRNCVITNNHTNGRGGGVYARNQSTPTLESCELNLNSTEIDGGAIFQSGGSLSLVNCNVFFNHARDNGGGLYIRNNADLYAEAGEISWNSTLEQDGAGIYLNEATFLAIKTQIRRNFSGGDGSGLAIHNGSSADISEARIKGNRACRDGGGFHINSSELNLDRTHVIQNSCGRNGGGISAINNAEIFIFRGFFRRNHSKGCHGGALYLDSVNSMRIDTCKFLTNMARYDGGGIYAENCSNSIFEKCAFAKNYANNGRGGAMHLISTSPVLDYCSFSENGSELESSAVYGRNLSMPTIRNSVMWGDIGAELILVIGHKPPGTGSNTTSVTYSDIEGGWPGANNLDVDPEFVAPNDGDLHLRSTSPVRGLSDDGSDLGAYQFGS